MELWMACQLGFEIRLHMKLVVVFTKNLLAVDGWFTDGKCLKDGVFEKLGAFDILFGY